MLPAPLSLLFLPLHFSLSFILIIHLIFILLSFFQVCFGPCPFPFLCVSHDSLLWSSSIAQCFLTFSPSLLCHITFSKHKLPPLRPPLPLYLLFPQLSTFPPLQFAFLLTPPPSSSCPKSAPRVLYASAPLSPNTCHRSSLTRALPLLCPLPIPF